jgi:hypothetical protein
MTKNPMTKLKALSAVVVVSAAIASPAFAQNGFGPGSRYVVEPPPWPHHYRSCFQGPGSGPCPGPLYAWSIGRDRSRPGGWDPYVTGNTGN